MHRRPTRLAALASAGLAVSALGLFAAIPADAATAASSTSAASSAAAAACDAGAWQSDVQGSPGVESGDRSGDYLWHDSHGFHLRVTHASGDRHVYTGVITASAAMRYTPVKLEKGDVVKLSADHRTLSFAFVNSGHIDGADFHTDCASSLTVSRLHVGNSDLSTGHVFLGSHRDHPSSVPFTLHRAA